MECPKCGHTVSVSRVTEMKVTILGDGETAAKFEPELTEWVAECDFDSAHRWTGANGLEMFQRVKEDRPVIRVSTRQDDGTWVEHDIPAPILVDGSFLTEERIEGLADEAEHGYDVDQFYRRG